MGAREGGSRSLTAAGWRGVVPARAASLMKKLIVLFCVAACALGAQPPILKPVKSDATFTGTFLYPKDVSVPPDAVKTPPPSYPGEWRDRDVKGEVQIAYLINEKGRTEQVQVIAANDEQFGHAAVAAVKQWRFRPAKKDGKSVRVLVSHPIIFTLSP